MRHNSSSLSLPASRFSFQDSDMVVKPLLLDVLASNMKVVVVSNRLPDSSEPFQNIRHNILLNIIVDNSPPTWEYPVTVTTLLWYYDRKFLYRRIDSFDQMIFWPYTDGILSTAKRKCCMTSLRFRRYVEVDYPVVVLEALMACNKTKYPTFFFATKQAVSIFEQSLLSRYSVSKTDTMSCYSLIRWRGTSVGALIKPFTASVWILTFFSMLMLAKLISALNGSSFSRTLLNIWMSLIAVISSDAPVRSYASVIASCSALILCFFVDAIYNNSIMNHFLDPRVPNDCKVRFDCRSVALCYAVHATLRELSFGTCLCNFNQKQQFLVGKPLQQKTMTLRKKSIGTTTHHKDVADQDSLYMQRDLLNHRLIHKHQFILVAVRASVTIDRLFAAGIVSSRQLDHSLEAIESIRKTPPRLKKYQRLWQAELNLEGFIDFDTSIDWFDMDSFRKLGAIFALCAVPILAAICYEIFPRLHIEIRVKPIDQQSTTGLFQKVIRKAAGDETGEYREIQHSEELLAKNSGTKNPGGGDLVLESDSASEQFSVRDGDSPLALSGSGADCELFGGMP